MKYCITLKSGKIIIFDLDENIETLVANIDRSKWLEVDSYMLYEKLENGSLDEYKSLETNRCSIRTCEIETIDYYVEEGINV